MSCFCRTSRTHLLRTMPEGLKRGSSGLSPVTFSPGTACGRSRGCASSGARYDLFRPGAHRLFDSIELLREEVIGAGHNHSLGVAHLLNERFELGDVAVLILRAVKKQHRPFTGA